MIDTKLIDIAIRDKDFLASLPNDLRQQISKICSSCSSDKNAKKEIYKRLSTEFAAQLKIAHIKIKKEKEALSNQKIRQQNH